MSKKAPVDTATALLDAVDHVISQFGPSGVTLRRVGTQAGLSHTAAAHYFNDKPGLFTAYITRAWSQVSEGVEAASQISDPRDALLAVAEGYADFALSNPAAFQVINRMELAIVESSELWEQRERGFFALSAIIERAQAGGWASSRDHLDMIATTWSLVHGFVDLWLGGPLWAPYDGNDLVPTLRRILNDTLDGLNNP